MPEWLSAVASIFLAEIWHPGKYFRTAGQYRKLCKKMRFIFTSASNRSIKKAEEQPSLLPFYFCL
jgi:hypothetical protein